MICNSANSDDFRYQLLPSVFQITGIHLYQKIFEYSESLRHRSTTSNWERIKQYTIYPSIEAFGYMGGMVALPITLCSTPLILLADIIVGAAECFFCSYHGLKKEDLLIIVNRKFIVSPCQHLTFCLATIAGYGAAYLLLSSDSLKFYYDIDFILACWLPIYIFAKSLVGMLPKGLNHPSFNIFFEKKSVEEFDESELWLQDNFIAYEQSKIHNFSIDQWKTFISGEIPNLGRIDDANLSPDYINFKKHLLNECEPQELLKLPDNFTQQNLKLNYRKLLIFIRPDRNQPRQVEADSLFKVLNQAYGILNSKF